MPLKIHDVLQTKEDLEKNIIVGFELYNNKNMVVAGFNTFAKGIRLDPSRVSQGVVSFDFMLPILASGEYFVSPTLVVGVQNNYHIVCWHERFLELRCVPKEKYIFGMQMFEYNVDVE